MISDNIFLIITIFEIIYIYFMLNIFSTYYSFHHPLEYIIINNLSDFFKHPIYKDEYSNKICPFGHFASKILILFLFLRYIIYIIYNKNIITISKIVLLITFVLSLMNMNAFIYLIPYFLIEIYLYKCLNY